MCRHELIPILPPAEEILDADLRHLFKVSRFFFRESYYQYCTKCRKIGYRAYGRGRWKHSEFGSWHLEILDKANQLRVIAGFEILNPPEMAVSFNATHPELQPGEEFYINIPEEAEEKVLMHQISNNPEYDWRVGGKAYTTRGLLWPSQKPLFRKKKVDTEQQQSEDQPQWLTMTGFPAGWTGNAVERIIENSKMIAAAGINTCSDVSPNLDDSCTCLDHDVAIKLYCPLGQPKEGVNIKVYVKAFRHGALYFKGWMQAKKIGTHTFLQHSITTFQKSELMISEKLANLILAGIDFTNKELEALVEAQTIKTAAMTAAGINMENVIAEEFPEEDARQKFLEIAGGIVDFATEVGKAFPALTEEQRQRFKDLFAIVFDVESEAVETAGEALFNASVDGLGSIQALNNYVKGLLDA